MAPATYGLIGVVGGALIAGGLATLQNERSARAAANSQALTLRHEREMATEARRQDRLAVAYLEMLKGLRRVARDVDRTFPVEPPSSAEAGQVATETDILHLDALGAAFASSEVRALLHEWAAVRIDFQTCAGSYLSVTTDADFDQLSKADRDRLIVRARETLEVARTEVFLVLEKIDAQVALELGSREPSD